jgi:hypothetical protein
MDHLSKDIKFIHLKLNLNCYFSEYGEPILFSLEASRSLVTMMDVSSVSWCMNIIH